MAEIVGVFGTSHTPVMLNFPDAIPEQDREDIFSEFKKIGEQLRRARPQAVVVISDDHIHNFFLDNLPAVCIGATDAYQAPVEHWLKVDKQVLKGDKELGAYLVMEALNNGFDPAFSMDLTLDHGVLAPLHLAGVADAVSVVPIMINCVQPPLPPMARAHQWGRFLGDALRRYDKLERVAILATGGISHDISTPRMGMVNEAFDREFLRLLQQGNTEALLSYSSERVGEAGNGAEEIRTWLMAHGAAGDAVFQTHYYKPMPAWYTGIALGSWVSTEGS